MIPDPSYNGAEEAGPGDILADAVALLREAATLYDARQQPASAQTLRRLARELEADDSDLTEENIDQMMASAQAVALTEPTSPAYLRMKAAAHDATEAAHLHAMHGMRAVYKLCQRYGPSGLIPTLIVLAALGLDENANPVLDCPHCGEDLTGYRKEDLVYRKGDHRPYCSGECVITMHRLLANEVQRCTEAEQLYGRCILPAPHTGVDCYFENLPLGTPPVDDSLCGDEYPGDENFVGQLCELPHGHFTDHRCRVEFTGTSYTALLRWGNKARL